MGLSAGCLRLRMTSCLSTLDLMQPSGPTAPGCKSLKPGPCRLYAMWDFVWAKMEEAPEPVEGDLSLTACFRRFAASPEGAGPLSISPAPSASPAVLLQVAGMLQGGPA